MRGEEMKSKKINRNLCCMNYYPLIMQIIFTIIFCGLTYVAGENRLAIGYLFGTIFGFLFGYQFKERKGEKNE